MRRREEQQQESENKDADVHERRAGAQSDTAS